MQDETLAYVKLTEKDGIGTIEFFHPNHNALPSNLLLELEKMINEAGKNDTIKVIVLQSAGNRTFCAGASLNELLSINNEVSGTQFFLGFANVINAMRRCPKIIICRVQGKAVGGGVGLSAAADYCLATKYAAIKLSELSIGIGPFVIEPAVSRKLGKTTMQQITLDAESFFSAEFAKEKGLYAEVLDSEEALDKAVGALAQKLSGYNPDALKEMKTVFWEGTSHWSKLLKERAEISGRLVLSDFTKKALERFK
ncbi:enoyl-CoA hydratase/isomerase family protein [Flavobacteriaceae bacterium XHP0103]|uniref:enoyl-CoA hydratase/isomerase family protein n=1 Tax=Marixanthotalea marina TaxID=2844359 RepID=UPI002989EE19|nr:enoyl-CoA hydratase/isomerase family protein [Marixanthotalea marina]MBU3821786.1 enoyl-CoA hydratase/isomerase family protein [Marixanthotalea marina]